MTNIQNALDNGVSVYFFILTFMFIAASIIFAAIGIAVLFFKYIGWLVGERW